MVDQKCRINSIMKLLHNYDLFEVENIEKPVVNLMTGSRNKVLFELLTLTPSHN